MKHLTILIPLGDISLSNVEGTLHIFSEVNKALTRAGEPPLFKLQLAGLRKDSRIKDNLFSIHPDVLIDNVAQTDLVIIPAIHGDLVKSLALNSKLTPWIIRQYKGGAEIASLCTSAFLLAATGLLNGRKCATHWIHANDFRKMFPEVNLVDDKIMTAEHGIYTSGAAYSYLNLLLYLIEKYADRDMAILSSKIFAIEIDRKSQSTFILFEGQKDHEDEPVKEAQGYIEAHFQDKITVDQLASKFTIGRRNLERRFKKATSNTVLEYIQRVKIEAAKKQLEHGRKTVNEVMYDVGYSDVKAFREVFKKVAGLSPLEYRNRYNKDVAMGVYSSN